MVGSPKGHHVAQHLAQDIKHTFHDHLQPIISPNRQQGVDDGPTRLVVVIADKLQLDFDQAMLSRLREEGFTVAYIHCDPADPKRLMQRLEMFGDDMDTEDKYAIIAYGHAAGFILDACEEPMPKLTTVVAYYPDHISNPNASYPNDFNIKIHLAGEQNCKTKNSSYVYVTSAVGFAESNMLQFNQIDAGLAWSRTMEALRDGLGVSYNIEEIRDRQISATLDAKQLDQVLGMVNQDTYINYGPAMSGAEGLADIQRFYQEEFIPYFPDSFKFRLISRTVGTDRVVDEVHVSFKHEKSIPWILPGVPPTDKMVEIAMINIVTIRGGRVCHERIYWDQASVLVQIGLLDPTLIPPGFQSLVPEAPLRVPAFGTESVRKLVVDPYQIGGKSMNDEISHDSR